MKPENRFITSVNDKIPKIVHREKMHNIYRGGTFDVWYSGSNADLWIEYKWIPRIPVRGRVVPDLSPLQLLWGRERAAEGRSVIVVVGCPSGGVIFSLPFAWEEGVSAEEFRKGLLTKSTLAAWIYRYATGDTLDGDRKKSKIDRGRNTVAVQDSDSRFTSLRASSV